MKPTWEMSIDQLKAELREKQDRRAGMDAGYGERWNGEEKQLDERIAFLDTLIKQRQKVGDVEDKSK
jgi:uncharacterized small protein (DUF1192 family)